MHDPGLRKAAQWQAKDDRAAAQTSAAEEPAEAVLVGLVRAVVVLLAVLAPVGGVLLVGRRVPQVVAVTTSRLRVVPLTVAVAQRVDVLSARTVVPVGSPRVLVAVTGATKTRGAAIGAAVPVTRGKSEVLAPSTR